MEWGSCVWPNISSFIIPVEKEKRDVMQEGRERERSDEKDKGSEYGEYVFGDVVVRESSGMRIPTLTWVTILIIITFSSFLYLSLSLFRSLLWLLFFQILVE